ncbi:hypothetical protein FCL47_11530 [Desulfopila sp. IMCC35006]|uniref:hypothetical protein n=1 Tax=Desulfopila sp. IMCC35006 TaxID=2569542 RepID=UPI0010AD6B43|nr:hypothetical protein [Desulfopila sp. IMCC35006]TKB25733.1 hypothetical protein FCL47_11530 [Desulfopila sp. IMCC35006]
MNSSILIETAATKITDCESVILVPEMALQEAGFIKTFTAKDSASAKHEYHALAQMAYFQYQDDELEIIEAGSPLTITCGEESTSIDDGMVLYRTGDGSFHVLAHGSQNRKKLLEAAYRYCTRWVRLDI